MFAVSSSRLSVESPLTGFVQRIAQLAEAEMAAVRHVYMTPLEWDSLDARQLGFEPALFTCLKTPAALLIVRRDLAAQPRTLLALELLSDLITAKALSARHVERFEQARLNLATEIHDDLSQNITFVRLALASLQKQVKAGRAERLVDDLAELVSTMSLTAEAVQKISIGLRPAMLDSLGPVPAIRLEAKRFEDSTGTPVECDLEDLQMPGVPSIAAFRIVQESFSNIRRHAHATHVVVKLQQGPGDYTLEIMDDGCGFDTRSVDQPLGLRAMAERAEIAGGQLSIESRPGKGTRIVACFPTKSRGKQ